ncbi:hypothetical protein HPG69_016976 [Diceros bicornis minor]|uniref:Uncharacterized protein n=1 Tax=Diceros bicornis minor TaxID=77932 RepID=A0A7J7EC88_DICBM|nr:hypothetical protein HPG69_016976 [Diceros bicornis minor]
MTIHQCVLGLGNAAKTPVEHSCRNQSSYRWQDLDIDRAVFISVTTQIQICADLHQSCGFVSDFAQLYYKVLIPEKKSFFPGYHLFCQRFGYKI